MSPAAELVLPAVRPPLDGRRSAVGPAATPAAAAEVPTITCRRLACNRLGDEPTVALPSICAASRRCRSVRNSWRGLSRPYRAARRSIAARICAVSKSSGRNGWGRRPPSRSSTYRPNARVFIAHRNVSRRRAARAMARHSAASNTSAATSCCAIASPCLPTWRSHAAERRSPIMNSAPGYSSGRAVDRLVGCPHRPGGRTDDLARAHLGDSADRAERCCRRPRRCRTG